MAPVNAGGAALGNDMAAHGFGLYDIAIGHGGFAWSERGMTAVQLPETDLALTLTPMQHRFPYRSGIYGL